MNLHEICRLYVFSPFILVVSLEVNFYTNLQCCRALAGETVRIFVVNVGLNSSYFHTISRSSTRRMHLRFSILNVTIGCFLQWLGFYLLSECWFRVKTWVG